MLTWYTTCLLLTLLTWTFLCSNRDAPHRLRFLACMVTLGVWLLPWPLLGSLWPKLPGSGFTPGLSVLSSAALLTTLPESTGFQWLETGLEWIITVGLGSGLLLFAGKLLQHRTLVRSLTAQARDAEHLWKVLDGGPLPAGARPALRLQGMISGALNTGLARPVIWLHESMQDDSALAAVLQHELRHIQQRDNFYLLLITLAESLFWWNPPVRLLGTEARELLELSCDEACAQQRADYRLLLNQLVLKLASTTPRSFHPPLGSAMFDSSRFNVRRIHLLKRSYTMKTRHYLSIMLTAAVAILGIAFAVAQPAPEPAAAETPQGQTGRTQAEILAGLEIYARNMEEAYDRLAAENAALKRANRELEQAQQALQEQREQMEQVQRALQEQGVQMEQAQRAMQVQGAQMEQAQRALQEQRMQEQRTLQR